MTLQQQQQERQLPPTALESFNSDLMKALNTLREKREVIRRLSASHKVENFNKLTNIYKTVSDIQDQQELKHQLETQMRDLASQINQLGASLDRDCVRKAEYDRLISETESAYMKVRLSLFCVILLPFMYSRQILESSETLLQVLQKESLALQK